MCKVSQPFVSGVRRQLKMVISSERRVGLDGKIRRLPQSSPAPTAKTSKALRPAVPAEPPVPVEAAATGSVQKVNGGAAAFMEANGLSFKLPLRLDLLQGIPFVPQVTIASLLVSAYGVAEEFDVGVGKEERLKAIDDLFITYERLSVIPHPSAKSSAADAPPVKQIPPAV
jgi:hypothetical protein